jgi:hypothetical protein
MGSPRRNLAIVLALAGVLVLAPAASAQVLFHADSLAIYDSRGTRVGTLTNSSGELAEVAEVVFRTESGHNVFVRVYPSRLEGTSGLWFAQLGCSGTPFVVGSENGRQPASFLLGPRQTVYVQVGAFSRRTMYSYIGSNGQCVDHPVGRNVEGEEFAQARRLGINLADYFTPPFALRATRGEPIPTVAVAEPLDATDRLVVFDATGKKVAAVAAYAVVTGSGITIPMDGVGSSWRQGYFQSTDCSGVPFMEAGDYLVLQTAVFGPGNTIYRRSGQPARRTMYSALFGNVCHVLRTRLSPSREVPGRTANFVRAVSVGIDFDDYFTEPFTVRAGSATRSLPKPN